MQRNQTGLSLMGFLLVAALLGLVLVLGMKTIPAIIEYYTILKNVNAIVSDASERGWGIKFLGANPAAGQTIRATLICRPVTVGIA